MWGIKREHKRWFRLLTLLGGMAGSIGLTYVEWTYGSEGAVLSAQLRNSVLGIGGSFIAAGFLSWSILHVGDFKEITVTISDWIKDAADRRRQRIREEGRQQGREEGREEMRREMQGQSTQHVPEGVLLTPPREAYLAGYEDAQRGRPLAARSEAYVDGYGDAQRKRPLDPPPDGA